MDPTTDCLFYGFKWAPVRKTTIETGENGKFESICQARVYLGNKVQRVVGEDEEALPAASVVDPLAVLPEELEGGGLLPEHGPGVEDGLVQGQLLGGRRGGLDQLLQGNRGGHFKKL